MKNSLAVLLLSHSIVLVLQASSTASFGRNGGIPNRFGKTGRIAQSSSTSASTTAAATAAATDVATATHTRQGGFIRVRGHSSLNVDERRHGVFSRAAAAATEAAAAHHPGLQLLGLLMLLRRAAHFAAEVSGVSGVAVFGRRGV